MKVQRFPKGHKYYSDAKMLHEGKYYQAVFGQLIDNEGKFFCYTMERKDTLIPEGSYSFVFYQSPTNGLVPLLQNVKGFTYIEIHKANWPFQIKGCTAVGTSIQITSPSILNSKISHDKLMKYLNNKIGTITYETLKQ